MKQELYAKITAYIIENHNKFYRLAYSYVRNREDALDVVQNAVCRALEHYQTLRSQEAVRTWFYRILVNECLMFLRSRKQTFVEDEKLEETSYEEQGFERWDDLYDSMSRLEPDTQTIIKLRFFEELSLKEIAQIMEMNLSTVKAKLYRGLKWLKVNVQEVDL